MQAAGRTTARRSPARAPLCRTTCPYVGQPARQTVIMEIAARWRKITAGRVYRSLHQFGAIFSDTPREGLVNSYRKSLEQKYPDCWHWISLARRFPGQLTENEATSLFHLARARTRFNRPGDSGIGRMRRKNHAASCGRASWKDQAAAVRFRANRRRTVLRAYSRAMSPETYCRHNGRASSRRRCKLEGSYRHPPHQRERGR